MPVDSTPTPLTYLLLIGSLLPLLFGPLLYKALERVKAAFYGLDAFILVSISGLLFLHLLPHSFSVGGWAIAATALIGFFLPLGFERHTHSHRLAQEAHHLTLLVAAVGVILHTAMDGFILSEPHALHPGEAGLSLPLSIVLHRLPSGLTVWWILRPSYGRKLAIATLCGMALFTAIGFYIGQGDLFHLDEDIWGLFEGLFAGSLLHVVVHRAHPYVLSASDKWTRTASSAGTLAAVALLLAFSSVHHGHEGEAAPSTLGPLFATLLAESAPALVIAYLLSGLLRTFASPAPLAWLQKGKTPSQAFRGMIFGLPLPICSCGVLPLYRTLVLNRTAGAAAIAFLIATPELGIDAFLLSFPLLGLDFALWRLTAAALAAFLSAIALGKLSDRLGKARALLPSDPELSVSTAHSFSTRILKGLRFGLIDTVDDTIPWVALGLGIAALLGPLLSTSALTFIPPAFEIPLFALIGIPLYVCASGATPLVAVLIAAGVSPGAALAFLLTGPATNMTTFGILSSLHGKRFAILFGAVIMSVAIGLGYMTNLILDADRIPRLNADLLSLREFPTLSPIQGIAVLAIGLLFSLSLFRQGPRGFLSKILSLPNNGEL